MGNIFRKGCTSNQNKKDEEKEYYVKKDVSNKIIYEENTPHVDKYKESAPVKPKQSTRTSSEIIRISDYDNEIEDVTFNKSHFKQDNHKTAHSSNYKRNTQIEKTNEELIAKSSNDCVVTNNKIVEKNIISPDLSIDSENEEINNAIAIIKKINYELKNSDFFHMTTDYKRMDRELSQLMVKLDDIEVGSDSILKEERKTVLRQILELNRILDSKIQCRDENCIICKSGME